MFQPALMLAAGPPFELASLDSGRAATCVRGPARSQAGLAAAPAQAVLQPGHIPSLLQAAACSPPMTATDLFSELVALALDKPTAPEDADTLVPPASDDQDWDWNDGQGADLRWVDEPEAGPYRGVAAELTNY